MLIVVISKRKKLTCVAYGLKTIDRNISLNNTFNNKKQQQQQISAMNDLNQTKF